MNRISGLKKISLILSVLLTLVSCRKDKDIFRVEEEITIGSSTWTGQISNFYSEVSDTKEVFSFDAAFAATFKTARQTEFHFNPFAFATEAGVIVDGDINIDVFQLPRKGDLILQDISTVIDDQLMDMMATYHVTVKKGNLPLRLAPGQNLQFTFPQEASFFDPEVEVIYGTPTQNGLFLSRPDDPDNLQEVSPSEVFDETEQVWKLAYAAESTQLGWFGCGRRVAYPSGTTSLCVNLPEGFNDINSAVYIVFDNYWSVVKLSGSLNEQQFCADQVPVGASVKIVSISERESGNFYLDFKDFLPVEGLENVVNLYPEATPINEIMVWIQSI